MVTEVTAFKTAGGKLFISKPEAENEEFKEMENNFVEDAKNIIQHTLDLSEISILKWVFRHQEEFKKLLEKYNLYD